MSVQMYRSTEYRSDIDGLRAVAILSVLFFHFGIEAFTGGYVGVDIFFVISGFLITRLIQVEYVNTGKFDFTNFYIRRMRRLFPALIFTFGLVFLGCFFLFSNSLFDRFSYSLASALLSLSNFYFWQGSDYFSPGSQLEPLLHTWSLSVEEQFYLIWPAAFVFISKRTAKFMPIVLVIAIIASLSLTELSAFDKETVFYLLPFRIFEFALGALIIPLSKYRLQRAAVQEAILIAGLTLIALAVFSFDKSTRFPSIYALFPCVGAALTLLAGQAKYTSKLLTNKPMVTIGLISYSLYLIHWPLIVFYQYYQDKVVLSNIEIILLSVTACVISFGMCKFIERPFRKNKKLENNKVFISGAASASLAALFASVTVHATEGGKWRTGDISGFKNTTYSAEEYSWETIINPDGVKNIIFYGDSHSKQYLPALEGFAQKYHYRIRYLGHPACLAWPGMTNIYQGEIHKSCTAMIDRLKNEVKDNNYPVIFAYRYTKVLTDLAGLHSVASTHQQEHLSLLMSGMERLIDGLGQERKIVIFGNVPTARMPHGYLDCVTRPFSSVQCHEKYPLKQGEFETARMRFEQLQHVHKSVLFVDPYIPLCDSQWCYVVKGERLFYSDHAHLTKDGAEAVINYFSAQIDGFVGDGL